jgi:hypothetical protein
MFVWEEEEKKSLKKYQETYRSEMSLYNLAHAVHNSVEKEDPVRKSSDPM